MAAGRIDGFCAGAPWGEVAAAPASVMPSRHRMQSGTNGTRKGLRGAPSARRAITRPAAGGIAGAAARRSVLRHSRECSAKSLGCCRSPSTWACRRRSLRRRCRRSLAVVAKRRSPTPMFRCSSPMPPISRGGRMPDGFLREMTRWGYLDADGDSGRRDGNLSPGALRAGGALAWPSGPDGGEQNRRTARRPWLLPAAPAPIPMGRIAFSTGCGSIRDRRTTKILHCTKCQRPAPAN